MCAPMALALGSFAIGAMQSVAQYSAASEAADKQNAYAAANRDAANKAMVNSYAAQQNQQIQERNAASNQLLQGRIDATKARATAITAAGEAGVGGLSVDALLGDYHMRESMNAGNIDDNYFMNRDTIRANMDSTQATAISRANSVQTAAAPSFFDAGLRIASAGLGAAGNYETMTNAATRGSLRTSVYG